MYGLSRDTLTADKTELSYVFSLDDMFYVSGSDQWYYEAGSHAQALIQNRAYTALSGTEALISTKGVMRFQTGFMGGSDGYDITWIDPFSSAKVLVDQTAVGHYAYNTVEKAIKVAVDEDNEFDIISIPGMVEDNLRNDLIQKIDSLDRSDALVLIDVDDGWVPSHEGSGTETKGAVSTAILDIKDKYNSSYAACYYPQVKLAAMHGGITVPATIAAFGVIAQSDRISDAPWFAPAGFNRGGIGLLGISSPVNIASSIKNVAKASRDKLYLEHINPISNFPGEGLVVFGQKTLRRGETASALDRINVRRLLIYLKRRIGHEATEVLFEQNITVTWERFKNQCIPILEDAKARFGLTDYRMILDETTTPPSYQDQNIMYAKVMIKPARAIEYIVVDFTITSAGVEF
jgi:hypothetical protein